jgi:hypothetical protein
VSLLSVDVAMGRKEEEVEVATRRTAIQW